MYGSRIYVVYLPVLGSIAHREISHKMISPIAELKKNCT